MATLYVVAPLTDECAAWLDAEGIAHPPPSAYYRNPTPAEIAKVVGALSEYTAEIRRNDEEGTWYADVSSTRDPSHGPWAEIAVRDYRGDEVPHEFCFTKGWLDVILLVTERRSHMCGPLTICDDAGTSPYLVQPGMQVATMIDEYNAR